VGAQLARDLARSGSTMIHAVYLKNTVARFTAASHMSLTGIFPKNPSVI
jgi:hypothetical protein